jgi:hypothetical protein
MNPFSAHPHRGLRNDFRSNCPILSHLGKSDAWHDREQTLETSRERRDEWGGTLCVTLILHVIDVYLVQERADSSE